MADTIMWSRSKQVNTNLVIKLNGGSTEGTNQFTYNGSTAKSINITPSSIGAINTAGTGLSKSSTTLNHASSITAGNGGPTANKTVSPGGTFTVPYFTYNNTGHITGRTNRTITIDDTIANLLVGTKSITAWIDIAFVRGDTQYVSIFMPGIYVSSTIGKSLKINGTISLSINNWDTALSLTLPSPSATQRSCGISIISTLSSALGSTGTGVFTTNFSISE